MEQSHHEDQRTSASPDQAMDHSYSSTTTTTQEKIVPDCNVTNYSQSPDITPAQHEPEDITESMNEAPSTDEANFTVVSSRKRKCPLINSDLTRENSQLTASNEQTGLTVIFVPVDPETPLTKINSLKLSETLQQLCQECIIMIRPNTRLNLIAVDTRNAQATKTLLKVTSLCNVGVKAYEPSPRSAAVGVIKGVDPEVTDAQLQGGLSAQSKPVLYARRLGKSSIVKVQFASTKLPEYALLSHVRYRVFPFEERPLQCANCGRYGHKSVTCFREKMCSRCGGKHDRSSCQSEEPNCVNCGSCHDALAQACPKREEQKRLAEVRKQGHTTASDTVQTLVRQDTAYHHQRQPQLSNLDDFPQLTSTSTGKEKPTNPGQSRPIVVNRTYSESLKATNFRQSPTLENDAKKSENSPSVRKLVPDITAEKEHSQVRQNTTSRTSDTSEPNFGKTDESFWSSALRMFVDMVRRFLNTQKSEWATIIQKGLDLLTPFIFNWIK